MSRAKTSVLNIASGLGVTILVNCVCTAAGTNGVDVPVGVSDTEGVLVMVGVSVMVAVGVIVGVRVGVGDGG